MKEKNDLKDVLDRFGICFERQGIYEFAPICLPWFSDECRANLEIELAEDRQEGGYVFRAILVPDLEGIVERTLVLASTLDVQFRLKEMFVARNVRENIISDIDGLDYSEHYNAYAVADSYVFMLALKRLLQQFPTKEPSYLGPI